MYRNQFFQPQYTNANYQTPDTGMIAAPSTDYQTPDTGMIEAPSNNYQTPDIGLMPAPPTNIQIPDTGMIEAPSWINNGNNNPNINNVMYMLNRCMNNMMLVRVANGEQFWFYPLQIFRGYVNGYRWNQQAGWYYASVPLADIRDLFCFSS